jgi:glycosyltransferase involved in cell wall biosynthesis
VSDIPALAEVVGDAGVRVPVGDVDEWARTIEHLAGDDNRRAELAVQGRARASSFTWASSAQAHRLAYDLATGPAS